jgi:transposase
MQITTIGLDIAKNVFQVHGIDAKEKVVARKQLRRSQVITFFKALPPCLIGMEACATAHYWARELTKLGHEVRLMPAKDVKAYVKRVHELQGDEDIDAKRSRPSIGKPVFGSCEERTRESVWDRSADHIRASGHTAALKGRIHDRTRTLR